NRDGDFFGPCAPQLAKEVTAMCTAQTVRRALAALACLALLSSAQAGDEGLKVKGQLKIGSHTYKMAAGKLYHINVDGQGFRPLVTIRPGFLSFTGDFNQRNSFATYFVPGETKEYRLLIVPDTFDEIGDGPFDYTASIKPIPLAEKPVLSKEDKLTE